LRIAPEVGTLQRTVACCNAAQHVAMQRNMLQRSATERNGGGGGGGGGESALS
jgi:hypothetical protein